MKKLYITILLIISGLCLMAVNVIHIPPSNLKPGLQNELQIEVLQGFEDISSAMLNYRIAGTQAWMEEPLYPELPEGPYLKVIIPSLPNSEQGVEYYFSFTMNDQTVETLPVIEPKLRPYILNVVEQRGQQSKDLIRLSEEDSQSSIDDYILAVSFFALVDQIDPQSIEVYVNNKNVNKKTIFTNNSLIYRESNPSPGLRTAMVTARLKDGTEIFSETWKTEIAYSGSKPLFPINLRGNWNFTSNYYNSTYEDNAEPFGDPLSDASSSLDVYGDVGILNYQTNLFISSLEHSNSQPVNRYTLGVQIPHWELFMGDYSPSFGTYAMNNKNIRGLYSRVHSKYFSLFWAHGEMVRKTTGFFNSADENRNDVIRPQGTFKQEAIATRIQIGGETGYLFGFTAARNRDIISSLKREEFSFSGVDQNGDPVTTYTTLPQDNLVLSADARLNLPTQKVIIGIEAAGSMLNRNTLDGAMTKQEIMDYLDRDSFFLDPSDYSGIFIINKNIEPLMPGLTNIAWNTYYRQYIWGNLVNISYSEAFPSFNSLSSNYLLTDVKTYSFTDQINYKQYLYASLGWNRTVDNLSEHRTDTNATDAFFFQSIVRFPRMPYLKFAYFNNIGSNSENRDVAPDSTSNLMFIPYERNSQSINIGLGYNYSSLPYVPTQFDLTLRTGDDENTQTFGEQANPQTDDIEYEKKTYKTYDLKNTSISFSMVNQYEDIPLRTQLVFSTNNQKNRYLDFADSTYANSKKQNYNLFLSGDYRLWEDKLKPYIQFRMVNLSGDQDGQTYNYYTAGIEAYPWRDMTANTSVNLKTADNSSIQNSGYNSLTWRFILSQRF